MQEIPSNIKQVSQTIVEDSEVIPKVDKKITNLVAQAYALIEGKLPKMKSLKDSAFIMMLRQFRRWLSLLLLKPLFKIQENYKGD